MVVKVFQLADFFFCEDFIVINTDSIGSKVYKSFFETVSNSDIFGKVDFESGIEETETKPQAKPKPVQVENQSGDTPF